jgi:hypothetical protein
MLSYPQFSETIFISPGVHYLLRVVKYFYQFYETSYPNKNFGNCLLWLLLEFSRFFWLDGLRTSSYIVSHQSNLVQMKIFLTL